jgi:hypothetical protein
LRLTRLEDDGVIRVRATANLLVAGVALLLTACLHEPPHSRLTWPNPARTTSFGAALPRVPTEQPYSFGVADVCVQGPSSVQVIGVSLVGARGQEVQAYALRPLPRVGDGTLGLGTEPGLLSQKGFSVTTEPVTVSAHCYSGDDPMKIADGVWEVGVQIARTSTSTSSSKAIRIDYLAEHRQTDALVIPFEITLCAPSDHVTPSCQAAP